MGALVAVFDPAGRIVRFNRACETTSGYDFATLVGRYAWDKLIPRPEIPEAIETFERLRSGHFPAAFENQWLNRDGSLRRIAWSATALADSQGQVAFIIATGIDVTTQRAAEATLRESEARYRQLVEGSLGMVCTHDLRGNLLSINTHGAETIGRTIEEMIGHNLCGVHRAREAALRCLAISTRSVRPAKRRDCSISRTPTARSAPSPTATSSSSFLAGPLTSSASASTSASRSAPKAASARSPASPTPSSSPLATASIGIDLDGKVTFVNAAAAQMLGYKQEEMLGRSHAQPHPPHARRRHAV